MPPNRRPIGRGPLLLLAVPITVFALVFLASFLYFRATDDAAPAAPAPPSAPTGEDEPRAPSGEGRFVLALSAQSAEPAESYLAGSSLDGSELRPITEPPTGGGLASDGYPAVSPDGQTIAFKRATAGPQGSTEPHIYLVSPDGSDLRRLTSGRGAELNPAWSPDGTQIAFARAYGRRFDIVVCAPDGSGLTRVTRTPGADEDYPAWSPDGTRFAFTRYPRGFERSGGDLWLADHDRRGARELLGGPGDHSQPAWSPDGMQIALVEEGDIAVMNADGTGVRPLTEGEAVDVRPVWSPDGSHLVFTRDPGTIIVLNVKSSQTFEVPLEAPASEAVWVPAA